MFRSIGVDLAISKFSGGNAVLFSRINVRDTDVRDKNSTGHFPKFGWFHVNLVAEGHFL